MEIERQKHFGAEIEKKISQLKEQLAENDSVGDPVSPDNAIGRLSRVDAMQVQAMRLALVRQRREELERLQQALRLVAAGKYGTCNGCGEDIPEKRLEAVPDTQRCVPCLSELQR